MMDQTQRAADGRASSVRPPYNHCHQHSHPLPILNLATKCVPRDRDKSVILQSSTSVRPPNNHCHQHSHLSHPLANLTSILTMSVSKLGTGPKNHKIWPPSGYSEIGRKMQYFNTFATKVSYLRSFEVNLTLFETNLTPTMGTF